MKTIVHSIRDDYGLIQVIDTCHSRCLYFDSIVEQSHMLFNAPLNLELEYQEKMANLTLEHCSKNKPYKLLMLGMGGGSLAKFLTEIHPSIEQTVIELRQAVIECAVNYFYLPTNERIHLVQADAAEFMNKNTKNYDVILIDIYDAQGMPDAFYQDDFQKHVWQACRRGALVLFNLWQEDKDNVKKLMNHWQNKKGADVTRYSIQSSNNIILSIQKQ